MIEEIVQQQWEMLQKQDRYQLKLPSESVVRFVFRHYPNPEKTKILDIGCGAGRDVLFLAKEGFETYGCDISRSGINCLYERMEKESVSVNVEVASIDELPYENNLFDCVLCSNVITYCDPKVFPVVTKEMQRVLKKGGLAFLTLRSSNDFRCGRGKKVGANTWIIEEEYIDKNMRGLAGVRMHFFAKEDISVLFSEFDILSIDRICESFDNESVWDESFKVILSNRNKK